MIRLFREIPKISVTKGERVTMRFYRWFTIAVSAASLFSNLNRAGADSYISNLGDRWMGQTPQEIGDIHALSTGEFDARFSTGAGAFSMNSVTLEFIGLPGADALANVNVVLFQELGSQKTQIGAFATPTVNPTPTQWPHGTTYLDFHPVAATSLQPFSEYSVAIYETSLKPPLDVGLLFTLSSKFTTPTDWRIGPTTTHDPFAGGEFLKFAADATLVPEPRLSGLILTGGVALATALARQRRRMPPRQWLNSPLNSPGMVNANNLFRAPIYPNAAGRDSSS